jgi:hypothetical protein
MTDRNDIAKVITDKEIEDMGAPYLAMAQAPPQAEYSMPPPTSYGPAAYGSGGSGGRSGGPLSLGGFVDVAGGAKDQINKLYPYAGMHLRYRGAF